MPANICGAMRTGQLRQRGVCARAGRQAALCGTAAQHVRMQAAMRQAEGFKSLHLDISEIDVDQARDGDDVGDALHALQHGAVEAAGGAAAGTRQQRHGRRSMQCRCAAADQLHAMRGWREGPSSCHAGRLPQQPRRAASLAWRSTSSASRKASCSGVDSPTTSSCRRARGGRAEGAGLRRGAGRRGAGRCLAGCGDGSRGHAGRRLVSAARCLRRPCRRRPCQPLLPPAQAGAHARTPAGAHQAVVGDDDEGVHVLAQRLNAVGCLEGTTGEGLAGGLEGAGAGGTHRTHARLPHRGAAPECSRRQARTWPRAQGA